MLRIRMERRTANIESSMRDAWKEGISRYTPVFPGLDLEEEDGSAHATLRNVQALLKAGLKATGCHVCDRGILIVFESGEEFLATGFAIAEQGPRAEAFAQLVVEAGLDNNVALVQRYLASLPVDREGEIVWPGV